MPPPFPSPRGSAPAVPARSPTTPVDCHPSVAVIAGSKLLLQFWTRVAGGVECHAGAVCDREWLPLVPWALTAGFEHMDTLTQFILCVKGKDAFLAILMAQEENLV